MSTAIKTGLLNASYNELANAPNARQLLRALIDDTSGSGGDVLWGACVFVDPVLGNDATAVPQSLKYTYETVQAALNAAAALAQTLPYPFVTVALLPGIHWATAPVVWPDGPCFIQLVGLTGDGLGASTWVAVAAGITGTLATTLGVTMSGFSMYGSVVLTCVTSNNVRLNFSGLYGLSLSVHGVGNEEVYVASCDDFGCQVTDVQTLWVEDSHAGTSTIWVRGTYANIIMFNVSCGYFHIGQNSLATEANLRMDRNCTVTEEMRAYLSGNATFTAAGRTNNLVLDLHNIGAGASIDIGGSQFSRIDITGLAPAAPGAPAAVRAIGCVTPSPNLLVILSGKIALDLRGLSGELKDSGITLSGGATCDRDWFGAHKFTFGPSGGYATATASFPDLGPNADIGGVGQYVVEMSVIDASGSAVTQACVTYQTTTGYGVTVGPTAGATVYTQCRRLTL